MLHKMQSGVNKNRLMLYKKVFCEEKKNNFVLHKQNYDNKFGKGNLIFVARAVGLGWVWPVQQKIKLPLPYAK